MMSALDALVNGRICDYNPGLICISYSQGCGNCPNSDVYFIFVKPRPRLRKATAFQQPKNKKQATLRKAYKLIDTHQHED